MGHRPPGIDLLSCPAASRLRLALQLRGTFGCASLFLSKTGLFLSAASLLTMPSQALNHPSDHHQNRSDQHHKGGHAKPTPS
jgi:hypothetical protein